MTSFVNECVFRAASNGTGDFVVAAAVLGYFIPADLTNPAIVDGETYHYRAWSNDQTQHEIGEGTYDVATSTLTRTTIFQSSNAGAAVVFIDAPVVLLTVLAQDVGASGPIALDDLTDVNAPTPNTNDVLTWSGTEWINQAVSGGSLALDDLTDVVATGGSEGDVLTQQSDGSFAMQAPSGGGSFPAPFTSTINDLKNNPATTSGLTWGYFGGNVATPVGLCSVADGTVDVVDDSFNVLAVNPFSGVVEVVSFNKTGVVVIAFVTASGGIITDTQDARAVLTDSRPLDLQLLNFSNDLPDAFNIPIVETGKVIRDILIAEGAGNAVTGGMNIGTTPGGSEVLAAFAVAGNSFQAVDRSLILQRAFSRTANTPLYVTAGSSWNSATVSVTITLDQAG